MAIHYPGLLAAALIALVFSVTSAFFLRRRGPWGSVWTFFLVLFLTLWTLSIYLAPLGPSYWGIAWIPLAIAGLIITVLLIASMPHPDVYRDEINITATSTESSNGTRRPAGLFFWVLVVLLVVAIVVGIMNPQPAL